MRLTSIAAGLMAIIGSSRASQKKLLAASSALPGNCATKRRTFCDCGNVGNIQELVDEERRADHDQAAASLFLNRCAGIDRRGQIGRLFVGGDGIAAEDAFEILRLAPDRHAGHRRVQRKDRIDGVTALFGGAHDHRLNHHRQQVFQGTRDGAVTIIVEEEDKRLRLGALEHVGGAALGELNGLMNASASG